MICSHQMINLGLAPVVTSRFFNQVYVEYTACHSRFCLVRESTLMEFVAGPFDTVAQARDYALYHGFDLYTGENSLCASNN